MRLFLMTCRLNTEITLYMLVNHQMRLQGSIARCTAKAGFVQLLKYNSNGSVVHELVQLNESFN